MTTLLTKTLFAAILISTVSEVAGRSPRIGAIILSLPLVSILAFSFTWFKDGDTPVLRHFARETLILVPLGLPFFVPLAISDRTGLSFWPNVILGILLAALCVGSWSYFAPPRETVTLPTLETSSHEQRAAKDS